METEEVSERYVVPCFVNALKTYNGEINLEQDKSLISNEFAVKLCLEHEVKNGDKMVKKELIVALRGEIYFVKFIINPEEDYIETRVILGRSFMRLTKGITYFGNGVITIYPKLDPFLDKYEETKKSKDDWELILNGIDFVDSPDIDKAELPQFINYFDKGPSLNNGQPLTQEEAAREAIVIDIYKRFSILEEARPVIETMAYSDKYKKILDSIFLDKHKLDGKIKKEEEEAVKRVMGEALKEKEDPSAFLIHIRLEAKINLNTLADIGSDINVMPFLIYTTLGRDEVNPMNQGITMLNHSKAEPMGLLKDVLCQIRVAFDSGYASGQGSPNTSQTSVNTKESDSDDEEEYSIKRNNLKAPIYGPNSSRKDDGDGQWHAEIRLTNPYGNIYDQGFVTKKTSKKLSKYHNLSDVMSPDLSVPTMMKPDHHDPNAPTNTRPWKKQCSHEVLNNMGCAEEIKNMLEIKVYEPGSHEELFSSEAWRRVFDINKPIYAELCHEFYSTYEFDDVCADNELRTKQVIKFRLCGHAHSLTLLEFARRLGLYHSDEVNEEGFDVYFQGGLRGDENFNAMDYLLSFSTTEELHLSRSLSSTIRSPILRMLQKMITYGLCQRTTGYDKVQKNELWLMSMFEAKHQNADHEDCEEDEEGCNKAAKIRYNTRLAYLLPRPIYSLCIVSWEVLNNMGCAEEIENMLEIKVYEAGSQEEIFSSEAWRRVFDINEPIYTKLCHEFYSTYEFNKVCADNELRTKKVIKFQLCGRAHSLTLLEFARRLGLYHSDEVNEEGFDVYFQDGLRCKGIFNATDYWLSISTAEELHLSRSLASTIRSPILQVLQKMITYGLCQRTTVYDKVQKNELWLMSMFKAKHHNGYANVAWLMAK
ncbi:hypothetical protein Tco_0880882 [Tanacetum coccineum]